MAGFAIAMKRRVAILQAAEHAQIDTGLALARSSLLTTSTRASLA
jgi:hypothetical protein